MRTEGADGRCGRKVRPRCGRKVRPHLLAAPCDRTFRPHLPFAPSSRTFRPHPLAQLSFRCKVLLNDEGRREACPSNSNTMWCSGLAGLTLARQLRQTLPTLASRHREASLPSPGGGVQGRRSGTGGGRSTRTWAVLGLRPYLEQAHLPEERHPLFLHAPRQP